MIPLPRVKHAELMVVQIPLKVPFRTSFSIQKMKEALLLRLSDDSHTGWGECTAGSDPFYSYETNSTAASIIRDYLIPILFSSTSSSVDALLEQFKCVRGHHMAKATVENALLDLRAKRAGKPLYQLLEGKYRKIESGISIGIKENIDLLLETVDQAVQKRYHRIKMKIEKGHDVNTVKSVREHFPDIDLMVDANAAYTRQDFDQLKSLDAFHLMMIEQPLHYDDIHHHAELQRLLKTPLCLDESIKTLEHAETAVEMRSCQIINIKQGRVGGLLNAGRIAHFCKAHSIPVWSGGMLETGIGRAFNMHLQTLPGFSLPGDTSETARYFKQDIVDKPVVLDSEGFIDLPAGPGIGVCVEEKPLKQFCVQRETLK